MDFFAKIPTILKVEVGIISSKKSVSGFSYIGKNIYFETNERNFKGFTEHFWLMIHSFIKIIHQVPPSP